MLLDLHSQRGRFLVVGNPGPAPLLPRNADQSVRFWARTGCPWGGGNSAREPRCMLLSLSLPPSLLSLSLFSSPFRKASPEPLARLPGLTCWRIPPLPPHSHSEWSMPPIRPPPGCRTPEFVEGTSAGPTSRTLGGGGALGAGGGSLAWHSPLHHGQPLVRRHHLYPFAGAAGGWRGELAGSSWEERGRRVCVLSPAQQGEDQDQVSQVRCAKPAPGWALSEQVPPGG